MARYDRHYDYGLRGFREAAPWNAPVRTRYSRDVGGPGIRGYDAGYGYRPQAMPNRVTARYNMDYVREQHPGERPINYVPYGGDRIGRVGDMREFQAPYTTVGGTRTWRGGGRPIDWDRRDPGYDFDYPRYRGGGYGRWF